jgi:FKBP-type peptidyl-prolyl cis-trans isomerase 2
MKQPRRNRPRGKTREEIMAKFPRDISSVIAVVILLLCLGLLRHQGFAAEPLQISDGSNVTFYYQITVPGEGGFEVRDFGRFVQGQHQLLPALERVVTGMKTGDEKKVELSAEEGFGPYDARKKKTVSKSDLPAGTKEGDVLEDHAGQQATVTQISDSSAVVDYNHPLAGKPLHVKIKILRVDNPS